jgi:hypothetical protein
MWGLVKMNVVVCLGMVFALGGCVTAQEQQQPIEVAVAQCQSERTPVEWMRCLNAPETRIAETERRTHPATATPLACSVMATSPSLCCAFASATSRSPTKPSTACLSAALAFMPRCRSRGGYALYQWLNAAAITTIS